MSTRTKAAKWTPADIKALKAAVKDAKQNNQPIRTAFEKIANETNRKAGSVQQKWYTMNPGPKRAAKATVATKKTTAKKTINRRVVKAAGKATPSPELKAAVASSLETLTLKRQFCETCETPFVGSHSAESCRDNLRETLTLTRSTIAASLPTNGRVPELV